MAGMTKRDILLSSSDKAFAESRHEMMYNVHQPIAATSKDGTPNADRTFDSMEALVDSFYSEQTAPYASIHACGLRHCSCDINDNDAESVRVAIEEQENEMLLMALSLSLHDGDRRHVDEASSGTDSECGM
jgi:hypothetical protein